MKRARSGSEDRENLDGMLLFAERAQDGNPRATARARVRRMTPEMRAAIPTAITKAEAMAIVTDARAVEEVAPTAKVLTLTARTVVEQRVQQARLGDLSDLRPVRRIGTYKGAPNRISGHPHVRRDGGPPVLLLTESSLELAWLRIREFTPSTRAMLTQPFALVWPVGDRCMWRVPDVVVQDDDGVHVVDVKPDDPTVRDEYTMAMLELTRLTVAHAGWKASIAGSLNVYHHANLREIASERTAHGLSDVVGCLRAEKPTCVGAALDLAGDDDDGMRAVLHLLTREVSVDDLGRPILMGTRLNWEA